MGLDLYSGPLSRYYAGDWQTILQRLAGETGPPAMVSRPPQPKRSWLSRLVQRKPATAQEAVAQWRDRLRGEFGIADLDWNEDPAADYATDQPAWDRYGALLLWAAYDELPKARRRATAEGWDQDSALLTSRMNPHSRYRHLLADTEIWLPIEFAFPRRTLSLAGDSVMVGSSNRLLSELRELNSHTWKADDQQVAEWRYGDDASRQAPLERNARFSFSIFYELAKHSVGARVPMKLDY